MRCIQNRIISVCGLIYVKDAIAYFDETEIIPLISFSILKVSTNVLVLQRCFKKKKLYIESFF